MALPADFDVDNPICPVCGSKVWDNRYDKRGARSPDFKCSNQSCDNGRGQAWAAWIDSPGGRGGGQRGGRAPQQAARPAPAPAATPPPRQSVTIEQWLTISGEVVLGVANIFGSLPTIRGMATTPELTTAMLAEVRSALATFWMSAERGIVRLVSDPTPTVPAISAEQYKKQLMRLGASDLPAAEARKQMAKIVFEVANDIGLTLEEKTMLSEFSHEVLGTIAFGEHPDGAGT